MPEGETPNRDTRAGPTAPGQRWRRVALAATVVIAVLALRWPQLHESIWYDEYCRTSLHLNERTVRGILLYDVHNPLYNAVMYLWIGVFGDSELSIRAPSLLAGMASALVFSVWLARRFAPLAGWVFGLAMAASPVHVWYSAEAKNTMFVMAASILSLVALDAWARRPRPWRTAAALVGVVSAVLTDFVTLLVVAPALVLAVRTVTRTSHRAVMVLGPLAVGLPLVIFKVIHAEKLWRDYLDPFTPYRAWRFVFGWITTGDTAFPGEIQRRDLTAVCTATIGVLVLLGLRRAAKTRGGGALIWAVLLPIPVYFAAQAFAHAVNPGPAGHIFQPRNLAVMVYPVWGVIAVGVLGLPWGWTKPTAAALLITLNAVGAVLMQTVHRDRRTVMSPNPDWRTISERFRAVDDADHGTPVLCSKSRVHPMRYYLGDADIRVMKRPFEAGLLDAWARESDGRAVYYVDDADWAVLDHLEWEAILGAVRTELVVDVPPVRIYRVRARGP